MLNIKYKGFFINSEIDLEKNKICIECYRPGEITKTRKFKISNKRTVTAPLEREPNVIIKRRYKLSPESTTPEFWISKGKQIIDKYLEKR